MAKDKTVTIAIENLEGFLAETTKVDLDLNITGITAENISTLNSILHPEKEFRFNLSETVLPEVYDISYLFENNDYIVLAPQIWEQTTNMTGTFKGCTNLISVNIPNGALYLDNCFEDCESLIEISEVPANVTGMFSCFKGCTSLESVSKILGKIRSLESCFEGCSSLVSPPELPSGVMYLTQTFSGCTALVEAPKIPESVINMNLCFEFCRSLKRSPVIPSSVTSMTLCFDGCTSLTDLYIFPAASLRPIELLTGSGVTTIHTNDVSLAKSIFGDSYIYKLCAAYDGLENFLVNLGPSTIEAPHVLEIVDIPDTFVNDFATKLEAGVLETGGRVYLDLRETKLPRVTSMDFCFYSCDIVLYPPEIPDSVISMESCFESSYIREIPAIPNSVKNLKRCFADTYIEEVYLYTEAENLEECFYEVHSNNLVIHLELPYVSNFQNCCFMNDSFYRITDLKIVAPALKSFTFKDFTDNIGFSALSILMESVETLTVSLGAVRNLEIVAPKAKDPYIFARTGGIAYFEIDTLKAESFRIFNFNRSSFQKVTIKANSVDAIPQTYSAKNLQEVTFDFPLPKDLSSCFAYCEALTTVNWNPIEVENLDACFCGCKSLTSLPLSLDILTKAKSFIACFAETNLFEEVDLSLPNALNIAAMFRGCKGLKKAKIIAPNVTNVSFVTNGTDSVYMGPFQGCDVLEEAQLITSSDCTDFSYTFADCPSLKSFGSLPSKVNKITSCFLNCSSLEEVPEIPSSVTDMSECFSGCSSLHTIHNWQVKDLSKVDMTNCFSGCASLQNIFVTEPKVNKYSLCYADVNDTTANCTFVNTDGEQIFSVEPNKLIVDGMIDELAIGTSLTKEKALELYRYRVPFSNNSKDFAPDDPHMVLWAKDKDKVKSNVVDAGLTIDTALSSTSTNPVQNKVVNAALDNIKKDHGYLCKLYSELKSSTSNSISQSYNVMLLGKIPDPASTAAPATPSASWDIDIDVYFVRSGGHKAAWCNVKAGYGYSNAWRKYGSIETFGVDSGSNYTNPFELVTLKYNNEWYIGIKHFVNIDGSYSARINNVNTNGTRNPSTATNTQLSNVLVIVPYKNAAGTVLYSEINSSIAALPNTYAPTIERNGGLLLKNETDVTLSSYGQEPLSIGNKTSTNLGIDTNEIQARNNGVASILYLNTLGGETHIGTGGIISSNGLNYNGTAAKATSDGSGNNIASTYSKLQIINLWGGISSTGAATLTMSQNMTNFKFILVEACMYSNPLAQRMYSLIPASQLLVQTTTEDKDNFLFVGTLSDETRRLRFYFPTGIRLYKLASQGASGHQPVITNVWGLK